MQVLRLNGNALGDEGICALALGLVGNEELVSLDLADNGASSVETAAHLGVVLEDNTTLCSLHLDGNRMGDTLGFALAPELVHGGLQELSLSDTGLGDAGLQALVEVLPEAPSLTALHLQGNPLSAEGIAELAWGLATAPFVEVVQLLPNETVYLDTVRAICGTMHEHPESPAFCAKVMMRAMQMLQERCPHEDGPCCIATRTVRDTDGGQPPDIMMGCLTDALPLLFGVLPELEAEEWPITVEVVWTPEGRGAGVAVSQRLVLLDTEVVLDNGSDDCNPHEDEPEVDHFAAEAEAEGTSGPEPAGSAA